MWAMIEKLRMWAWSAMSLFRGYFVRSSAATQPAGDERLDLVRLGNPHRQDGPRVEHPGERAVQTDRDGLGQQAAAEDGIEALPHEAGDARHQRRGDEASPGGHQHQRVLEPDVEAD